MHLRSIDLEIAQERLNMKSINAIARRARREQISTEELIDEQDMPAPRPSPAPAPTKPSKPAKPSERTLEELSDQEVHTELTQLEKQLARIPIEREATTSVYQDMLSALDAKFERLRAQYNQYAQRVGASTWASQKQL